jgi:Putative prokaryotic signal transducing protein
MKTVRTYQNLALAGFDRSLLEAGGIDAVLLDENTVWSGVMFLPGGMRLQVPEEDFDRALEILGSRIPDSEELACDEAVVPEHEVPETQRE